MYDSLNSECASLYLSSSPIVFYSLFRFQCIDLTYKNLSHTVDSLTFKYLFFLCFNERVPERTRFIVVNHGPWFMQVLFMDPLIVGLPLLLEYSTTVILWEISSVHVYFYFITLIKFYRQCTFDIEGFWGFGGFNKQRQIHQMKWVDQPAGD